MNRGPDVGSGRSRTGARSTPPHNLEAEKSVLGAVFIKPAAFDEMATALQVDDFFLPAHREIFDAMLASTSGASRRRHRVADELKMRGMLPRLEGGEAYLSRSPTRCPPPRTSPHYARLVKEKATLRRLIAACAEVQSRAYGDFGEFEPFLDEAETAIFKVAQQNRRETYSSAGEMMEEVLHNIEVRASERKAVTGVPTGFTKLDEYTAGLQRENLIIVAARPGGGKTSWAVNVAMHAAMNKIPVLIFSLEMSKYELMERMLAGEARIDSSRIKRGFLEYSDWKNKIHPASGRIAEAPILIDDSSAISIMEIRAKARRFRSDPRYFPPQEPVDGRPPPPPLGLIVVDYLQLARGGGGRRDENRAAGDRRDLARAQVAGQGSQAADHRGLAAEPRGREARGQAQALRPARVGRDRAGRRPDPVHPPRGHGRRRRQRHRPDGGGGADHRQAPQRRDRRGQGDLHQGVHPLRELRRRRRRLRRIGSRPRASGLGRGYE